jgi:DNA-binding phage protein
MVIATLFDAAEYLDGPEMIAAYLSEASESEDPVAVAMAIAAVERARPRREALNAQPVRLPDGQNT